MELITEVRECINKCVLCWLATASADNVPNVSPKEIFSHYGAGQIIIANIASPQTVRNIRQNEHVCVSFIDILVQKGFQVKGTARIIEKTDSAFAEMEKVLTEMTGGNFPFATITAISVRQVKPIIAPILPSATRGEILTTLFLCPARQKAQA